MKSVSLVLGAVALVAVGCSEAANAATVDLHYTGTVSSSSMSGVNDGDTITFDVFADNGGSGLNSQTWTYSQILSASISAGTYSGQATGSKLQDNIFGGSTFSTNASGQLTLLNIGIWQSGSDTAGNDGFSYYMNAANPIWLGHTGFLNSGAFSASTTPDTSNTQISFAVSTTPLPAALPMFASGLVGFGALCWRRKRKQPIQA